MACKEPLIKIPNSALTAELVAPESGMLKYHCLPARYLEHCFEMISAITVDHITYLHMYVTYVCMYVCMYVCTYVRMYVRMYVCMHVCMYARMYVCMHVCMYARMYVCMYVCTYVCTYHHRYYTWLRRHLDQQLRWQRQETGILDRWLQKGKALNAIAPQSIMRQKTM